MAQRQPRFSLSQPQFSRRQKRRPRRPKLAFTHLLLAAVITITIFYAIIILLYDRTHDRTQATDHVLDENGAGSQHTPAQNIQNRNEDDREDAPETGKKEERDSSMQGYSVYSPSLSLMPMQYLRNVISNCEIYLVVVPNVYTDIC